MISDTLALVPSNTERGLLMASDTLALARSYIVSPNGVGMTQAGSTALLGYIGQGVATGVGHTLIGAKIGAALGTGFLPGVGTVVGGILGYYVANWVVEFIDEL
jgi:hypothetical protein